MDPVLSLALGSLKALLLLIAAGGVSVALRGRPARLRAVVWGTALAGSLLIPIAATLLPAWSLPLPFALPDVTENSAHVHVDKALPVAALTTEIGPPISPSRLDGRTPPSSSFSPSDSRLISAHVPCAVPSSAIFWFLFP